MIDIFAQLEKLKKHPAGGAPTGQVEYIVVGLGNPGTKYDNTRHNAGFLVVDRIAKKLGISIDRLKFKSLTGDAMIAGHRVLFLKPSTFMNNSGEAVRDAAQFHKVPSERIIVIFDDISLDVGGVRIRRKGSDGGHNGIKSIIYLLGKDDFPRIKIGVGKKPHPDYDLADWVLSRFTEKDFDALNAIFDNTLDMITKIIEGNIDAAMNKYNR
ncbi:PTH1 family peptidyl-tRNA hydrolase [Hydrogenoanaerobacterium saccharovorans]|uniref:Peptidyl-tRNA hydrolase n=1 Tax=Hydrogenoanaerobacterium saccharovorans TaxID=474960 RepID=A0A1H8DH49_9FIRM|nr:aminoacyl-tRNA hydrolase [Hydrogenoanaerobacterium saccharovorans]RPF42207.1 PTH1 family peptidyl-tRNA hydrolase [Hydrogenoanaerobacterium saccharovorans]SEN06570.1 peptidyl-tRNA hydrolase, PTH1 family [Hydrogenoanaerobacterium saccharovorans]